MITTIVFDVGETLTRDDRYWGRWADWLGVPRHTLSALVGAVVAQGRDNADAVRLLRPGIDLRAERAAMEQAGVTEHLDDSDLYGDVRSGLTALRKAGYAIHIAGNQTVRAGELLRALDLPADSVSTSAEWGIAKPDLGFFERVLQTTGTDPSATLYVGDHPANDIVPARAAGLRACLIRRGPWGHLWSDDPNVTPDWKIDGILELRDLLGCRHT
ncbi:HAD family hydrolase [Streptomyces sp. NBC_01795]|uniref:HAD family hydrolase n=1 Tax=Streptomyces sp. NBC_01795 TaxID=2975943 RepID=UPI002DD8C2AE|nr:HAD family hydrolase [Streptomyces sp. NBC_01795]WSA95952.1 HAD family hydrolase [Streptomyces sp. NBC_01795]